MTYTRRDFVNGAAADLGVSTNTFDLPPERLEEMRERLDRMMATWNARGIRLSYPLPSGANTPDLDDDTDVPDKAWEAIVSNLAIRCASLFGKMVGPELRMTARDSYNALLAQFAGPPVRNLRRLPSGMGNKPWRYLEPFTTEPEDVLSAGPDSDLEF
jgi:hypothetical protein